MILGVLLPESAFDRYVSIVVRLLFSDVILYPRTSVPGVSEVERISCEMALVDGWVGGCGKWEMLRKSPSPSPPPPPPPMVFFFFFFVEGKSSLPHLPSIMLLLVFTEVIFCAKQQLLGSL